MARQSLRAWLLVVAIAACLSPGSESKAEEAPLYLDQGWSKEIREQFYHTPQGSRMIPYAWFRALEAPEGEEMFASANYLTRYGLLAPNGPTPLNPDQFPIGFAIDPSDRGQAPAYLALDPDPVGSSAARRFVGLTCAACHTSTVTVEGRPIRIDGAPANFDFDSFYRDLAQAVTLTLLDRDRFARFASRVLGTATLTGDADLRLRFAAFQAQLVGDAALRRPLLESGFGRVDALTQIVNSIAVRDQKEPANLRAVGAPTSYPPLWLTHELEFVQWNPIASSPIGRNGGQVLGVFGEAVLSGEPSEWYASSVLLGQLHAMETWIGELKPPKWDEDIFGEIDDELAEDGEALFRKNCAGCHNMVPYRRTDPEVNFFGKTFIEIGRVDYQKVGTDPLYVQALVQRLIKTNAATARLLEDQEIVPAAIYFLRTVGAVIRRAMDEAGLTDEEKAAMNGFRLRKTPSGQPGPYLPSSLTDLKASPLAGVWATGPYLHNGSVPTVYDLLSPPEERPKVFWTGGRELDRERLGFVSGNAPGRFRFDTALPGNRNTGHRFPARGLSPEQRMAIIEYLKTQ